MQKSCNYAFILYPESCNPYFPQILKDLGTPAYYIKHDKDVILDEEFNKVVPKKSHFHVFLVFPNPRSENTAKKICLQCGGNGYLETVVSRKGYARYLMHLDDKLKYQYERQEVYTINATGKYDYDKLIATEADLINEYNDTLADIITYCKHNYIIAFSQLVDYCVTNRRDWLPVVRKNTHMLYSYIQSMTWAQSLE